MGGAGAECAATPWELWLEQDALVGPQTSASIYGPCDNTAEAYINVLNNLGTFDYDSDAGTLQLLNCEGTDGMGGASSRETYFDVTFTNDGDAMKLTRGDTEYYFERADLPKSNYLEHRLISTNGTDCESRIKYRWELEDDPSDSIFIATLLYWDDQLYMDELFNAETSFDSGITGGDWNFYYSNYRDIATTENPPQAGDLASHYQLVYDYDLKPLSAVGYEVTCGGSDFAAYEHDFVRDVVFRRFWNTGTAAFGGSLTVDVSGLTSPVQELIVTFTTSGATDAADLTVTLKSPDGTSVTLVDGENGDGSITDFDVVSLADFATTSVTSNTLTAFDRLMQPENPLSEFNGETANGTWTLEVTAAAGSGSLDYFGLSIR